MKAIDKLEFRKLDLAGLHILVDWALNEGWNPGPYDAEVYYNTDPDGFYGFFLEGTLIAGGSIVSYHREFGFMGFFIVRPAYRDLGIGRGLWYQRRDKLISRLNKGATIGMDGVLTMQPFYKKGGFEIAYKDIRYKKNGVAFKVDKNIASIKDDDFDKIMAYDKKCFGFERPQFMKQWLQLPNNRTFKYVENNILKGFVIVRKATIGYKICPLFADNEMIAEALYKASLNSVIGMPLYLDIPTINQGALHIVNKYKAAYVFECARMYYGKVPKMEVDKVYGVTTFELG